MKTIPWRGEAIPCLALGTVQLGMPYGIANVQGLPDQATATAIVAAAWECGIRWFDTAQFYGSEAVLGRAFRELGIADQARICTKLSHTLDPRDVASVAEAITRSFENLGVDRVWCMMLHRVSWLEHWETGLGALLVGLRDEGRFEYLGASLLTPSEGPASLARDEFDVLQLAASAWDQRMQSLGILDRAERSGRLCFIRSVYLQGLLTMLPEQVAKKLPAAEDAAKTWHELAAEAGLPPVELALRYALGFNMPLVAGAETPRQIQDTVEIAQRGPLPQELRDRIETLMAPKVSQDILEPFRWPKT